MPELKKVLVTAQLSRENMRRLEETLYPAVIYKCHPDDRAAIEKCIDDVDAAILAADAAPYVIAGKHLKWIHCCHAGLDQTACPEVFSRGIVLTGSAGRSAPALAEHAVMFMLGLTYDLPMLQRAREKREWCSGTLAARKAMNGKTVGIIGMGNTGRALVKLLKAFDMRILAWRRKPDPEEGVEKVYSAQNGEKLKTMLEQCDFVVLCAGLNDQTWHIINSETLGQMRKGACLINIGRGALVDEAAMIESLRNGWLAGAGLDNFETEPLPENSPLWDMPNVLMTPHATPCLEDREDRAVSYVLRNIEAFRRDGEFVNRLTEQDVYTHR